MAMFNGEDITLTEFKRELRAGAGAEGPDDAKAHDHALSDPFQLPAQPRPARPFQPATFCCSCHHHHSGTGLAADHGLAASDTLADGAFLRMALDPLALTWSATTPAHCHHHPHHRRSPHPELA
ncbi:hypothetical protein PCANC_16985 [Puccinia coronata f. sp. avenae]|uniref:Uncharacterized protein n=1 Tax=Puccinia coronata f. sp. avenae TaxID=200324 RepID=A0A2N5SLT4_9BASI|nr:hypothetical protein PCANC_16985 [Puccinia coronata f. sp. avenae]